MPANRAILFCLLPQPVLRFAADDGKKCLLLHADRQTESVQLLHIAQLFGDTGLQMLNAGCPCRRHQDRVKKFVTEPGNPNTIVALGPQSAEMTTDVGAIYRTTDGGKNWKAMVQEAVGVLRNIARSPDGKYIAVSAKGNFYSTWEPGQNSWQGHNRNSSRRVQNMGFGKDGRLWMLARGGQIQFTSADSPENWEEVQYPELSTSWGLLDLAYRTPNEIWISGGSGNLLCSLDDGKTWQKDREVENVASNLYKIVFVTPEQGFIIGQRGVLLRYQGQGAVESA